MEPVGAAAPLAGLHFVGSSPLPAAAARILMGPVWIGATADSTPNIHVSFVKQEENTQTALLFVHLQLSLYTRFTAGGVAMVTGRREDGVKALI